MIHHIQFKLETAERMAWSKNRSEQNRVKRVLGYQYIEALRIELAGMKASGYKVIPTEGCEHDGTGVCPGHEELSEESKS